MRFQTPAPLTTALLALAASLAAPSPAIAGKAPSAHVAILAGLGWGDGNAATAASLRWPRAVAVGPAGILVADGLHYTVRVVGDDGIIRRFAGRGDGGFAGDGGPAAAAQLDFPQGVAVDEAGNLYVADTGNHRVRRVDAATGRIATIAGSGVAGFSGDGGPATAASLNDPTAVAAAPDGSVYIVDYRNLRVRRVAPDGTITTVAGNGFLLPRPPSGPATASGMEAVDVSVSAGGTVYVADRNGCLIRSLDPSTGFVATVAGSGVCGFAGDGGAATAAQIRTPDGVHADASGRIWIADTGNSRLRLVGTDGVIRTVAGNGSLACAGEPGPAAAGGIRGVSRVATDPQGNAYLVAPGCNRAWRLTPEGTLEPFAGNGGFAAGRSGDPARSLGLSYAGVVAVRPDGRVFFNDLYRIWSIDPDGTAVQVAGSAERGDLDGPAAEARFDSISGMAFDGAGGLWIADEGAGKIKRLTGGVVQTMAGTGVQDDTQSPDGPALETKLFRPYDVAPSPDGSVFFTEPARIRVLAGGSVRTLNPGVGQGFSGDGGPVAEARFALPQGIAIGPDRSLYVVDKMNHRVRRIGPDGQVSTAAGDGAPSDRGDGSLAELASFPYPEDVAVDENGNLFVSTVHNSVIRQVAPNGMVTRVGGTGVIREYAGEGPSTSTPLHSPVSLAVGPDGLVVADASAVKLVTRPSGGWPSPTPVVVCEPLVVDPQGDGAQRLVGNVYSPNAPWIDIRSADLRSGPATMTATFRVDGQLELAAVPAPGALGSANVWVHVMRRSGNDYRYIAAIAPATLADPGTSTIHVEYGRATVRTVEAWNLIRLGAATGTVDVAASTIRVTAPLGGLGFNQGDVITYQEGDSASLFEYGLDRWVLVDDRGGPPNGIDAGQTRSYRIGGPCSDAT